MFVYYFKFFYALHKLKRLVFGPKVDCAWVQDRLAEYVRWDLSQGEFEAVEEHLHTCSECQAQHEKTRQMVQMLWRLNPNVHIPTEEETQEQFSKLMQRVEEYERTKTGMPEITIIPSPWEICQRAFSGKMRWIAATTVLLFVALPLGRTLFNHTRPALSNADQNLSNVTTEQYGVNGAVMGQNQVIEQNAQELQAASLLAQNEKQRNAGTQRPLIGTNVLNTAEIDRSIAELEARSLLPQTEEQMTAWARKEYPHILWLYDVLTKPEFGINWNGVPASIPAWAEQFYPDAATRPKGWRALVIYSGDAFRFDFPQTAVQPNVLPRLQSLQLGGAVAGYDAAFVPTDGQELPALAWVDRTADTPSMLRLTAHPSNAESILAKSLVPPPVNIPEDYAKQLASVPTQSVSVLQYVWVSSTLLSVSSKGGSDFSGLANKCQDDLIIILSHKTHPWEPCFMSAVTDLMNHVLQQRNAIVQEVQNSK